MEMQANFGRPYDIYFRIVDDTIYCGEYTDEISQ